MCVCVCVCVCVRERERECDYCIKYVFVYLLAYVCKICVSLYVTFLEGVAPFPTPWCSRYRKGRLRVTLDYGRLYVTLCDIINVYQKTTWEIINKVPM